MTSTSTGTGTGPGTGPGRLTSFFKGIIGGKVLTEADLAAPLDKVCTFLTERNVARPVAETIVHGLGAELVGTETGSWESVQTAVQTALHRRLAQILTSATPTSLLAEIAQMRGAAAEARPRPYVISVVGVNGVGKSTSLSKIAYWLLSTDHSILVAACDTFRSGAVEQLRVHVQNLKQLATTRGRIDLFEQGYNRDAALVARDAVAAGRAGGYDVVLIDTAGRRHNDQRLMGSLEKLARPDKIFMVAEALVGTDSVLQARHFNSALGRGRGLDGFIISKVDTVGEMVGTLVSMTHALGIPVVFVGVGQTYQDLRSMSVDWVVRTLMGGGGG